MLLCEGGLAYLLARKICAERLFRKRFGMDYTPIVRNEHVSTLAEVQAELEVLFQSELRVFFPLGVPLATFQSVCGVSPTPT